MHPPPHTHTQLVKRFTHMRTRLHPWPTLRGPTVLCCCPRSSHGTQSVGKNAHKWIRARATARTDSVDRQRGRCGSLSGARARENTTDGHAQKHMHSHALSRRRGPSPPALGMGPAALDAFGCQLLHMGSVCLCVCASVFEGRRLGAGG